MSCRARVADRALVSSRGSDDPRGMNWAWAGFGTVMGRRNSEATPWEVLVKLESEAIRRLMVLGALFSMSITSRKARTSATETVKSRVDSSGQWSPRNSTKARTSWR